MISKYKGFALADFEEKAYSSTTLVCVKHGWAKVMAIVNFDSTAVALD
jgi:hypothetical protein